MLVPGSGNRKPGGSVAGTVLKRNLFGVPRDIIAYPEVMEMAKPIELGLVLEGEDARRFHEYMERPTYTDDARKLIRFAAHKAQNKRL